MQKCDVACPQTNVGFRVKQRSLKKQFSSKGLFLIFQFEANVVDPGLASLIKSVFVLHPFTHFLGRLGVEHGLNVVEHI